MRSAADIFWIARGLPVAERGDFLDQECAADQALRARVERLLQADQRAGEAEFLVEPERSARGPRTIGPYRILRELGRGGQATVYLAHDPQLDRELAVKILRTALSGEASVLAQRFAREAKAVARLDHPGVCAVYETGVDAGRPWIAMRYVDGRSLADWLAVRPADATAGLDLPSATAEVSTAATGDATPSTGRPSSPLLRTVHLVEQVARALHAAHELGLVHRDVKPANLMVTPTGQPVLLDFGIAHAGDTETGLGLTHTGDLLGTPAYMAPEQLRAGSRAVDRRTDVYALGVTLYECLCGARPFQARSRDALYRQILETEPQPLRLMVPGIPRDLDVVVAKAIDKDPERRYATALEFAEDLRRIRCHEPVRARPISVPGRLVRWARRRPLVAASLAGAFLALGAGFGMATWGYLRADALRLHAEDAEGRALRERDAANDARDEMQRQRERADREAQAARDEQQRATVEAARAKAVVDLVRQLFESVEPRAMNGPGYTVREMLDAFDLGLGERLRDQPAVEATLRRLMASAYDGLGDFQRAAALAEQALGLDQQEFGAVHLRVLRDLQSLTIALGELGRFADSVARAEQAVAIAEQLFGPDHFEVGLCLNNLANGLRVQGRLAESAERFRQALRVLRVAGRDHDRYFAAVQTSAGIVFLQVGEPGLAETETRAAIELFTELHGGSHPDVARARLNLAAIFESTNRSADAVAELEESRRIYAALLDPQHPDVANCWNNLVSPLASLGRLDEAEAAARKALGIRRAALGDEHPSTARTLGNLGRVLEARQRLTDAESCHREAVQILRKVHRGAASPELAECLSNLAGNLVGQGRITEAAEPLGEAFAMAQAVHGTAHPWVLDLASNLSVTLLVAGDCAGAERVARDERRIAEQLHGAEHPTVAQAWSDLSQALACQRRFADSAEACRQVLGMRRMVLGDPYPEIERDLLRLAAALSAQAEFADAEAVLRECFAICEARAPDSPQMATTMGMMGEVLMELGRLDDAEPLLLEAAERHRAPQSDPAARAEAFARLVEFYERRGDPVQAAGWRKQLDGMGR